MLDQEKGRFTVETQPQNLQDAADTWEGADAAPGPAHEKPAHYDADPPDPPSQEERDVTVWILGTEQPQENNEGKSNIPKAAKVEKVVAILIESFDPWKKSKQIDTRLFVENK